MHIVCPHCTTSYAVNPASFGEAGRTVRCSRCKETWLARPEDTARAESRIPSMAEAEDQAAGWGTSAQVDHENHETPSVESPSIAGDWPEPSDGDRALQGQDGTDWPSVARLDDALDSPEPELSTHASRFRKLFKPSISLRIPTVPFLNLPTVCAAMGALIIAVLVWRADVVRLLPQTSAFYKIIGLDVNLRGLVFKDVKISTETADGKPVMVIEGMIVSETRKAVELPRLRFSVRDAQDVEIYAWNAVLEQAALNPGEKAWFRSRLASPPPEGRNIDVRFFNKRDINGGGGA